MTFVKVTTFSHKMTNYVNLDKVRRIWVEDGGTYLEFKGGDDYVSPIFVLETPGEIFAQVVK
jgi:hypothetical protein